MIQRGREERLTAALISPTSPTFGEEATRVNSKKPYRRSGRIGGHSLRNSRTQKNQRGGTGVKGAKNGLDEVGVARKLFIKGTKKSNGFTN